MRSKRPKPSEVLTVLKKTGFFKKRKGLYLILTLVVLLIPLFFKTQTDNGGRDRPWVIGQGEEYTVEDVIDGDTVVLEGVDTHVRYLEIDSPEVLHEDSAGDPLSEEAKNFNKGLVHGKKVKLEFDKEKYDDYGRMLAYVFVDGTFVNEEIVRNGLARILIIKPNDKYASVINEAEDEAKRERKGIWGSLDNFNYPPENRDFLIKPPQASRYIGQRVVVRGKITDFRKSAKVLALNMEDDLDIVIFSGDWENFRFFGITPEKYYVGKPVEVTGRVKMYKGRPQIIVSHPILIRDLR